MGVAFHLVLRVTEQESAHLSKEIGALSRELVLRQIPGKSVERRRQLGRLAVALTAASASEHSPGGEIVAVAPSPARLRLDAARRLA